MPCVILLKDSWKEKHMPELRSVIARNIAELRKSASWTQAELAQRLNYSDKTVSKWERAESTPDVDVLKNMADLFQVPVCYFFEEHPKDGGVSEPLAGKLQKRNRIIIALVSVAGLFAVATVLYVLSGLLLVNICDPSWMLYIYAIPPSLVLLLVFNSVWGPKKLNLAIITALIWTVLLAVFLSFHAPNRWMVFLIGIPAQVIVLLLIPVKPVKLGKLIRPWHKQPGNTV
jgi:transcriptional regulator with XRE-family HTH domain